MSELKIVADLPALYRAGADEFTRCAREAIAEHGRFAVALSGGSTPKGVYSLLAQDNNLPWEKIHFFFSDERHVPPDHPDSNYRMANESLLSKVAIPPESVHRIAAELDAEMAAAQYEDELRNFFQTEPDAWPRFDLIMLGMGPDGHTASLFPGSAALNENSHWVVANWVEKFKAYRITFTFSVINQAAEVMFLVAGQDKSQVLKEVLRGKPDVYPCQRVKPMNGRLLWIVDKSAASLL
jgi:6-phosphogluconolactonase